jgi:hypothetical protein
MPMNAPSNLHPALSNRQMFALIAEAQSARNLLRDAITAIRNLRSPTLHTDAVFTLGSIGIEKTMKVLLGCAEIERSGKWPTIRTMQTWSHNIDNLASRLNGEARSGLSRATATGYATTLVERIESSEVLPLLFAALSRYGGAGRFHNLDVLATNSDGDHDPPEAYWSRLSEHVGQAEPVTVEVLRDPPALDAFLGRLSGSIADELDAWWFAVHRLGVQGCFGTLGSSVGWELWDQGRTRPPGF